MQRGQSKDHRPDLPQLKLMAAAAEPTGLILATEVHPGNTNDDPLYLPLITRVREVLGRRGLLYCGDCKMAALETRADLQRHGDYYLVPLPLSPGNAALLDRAVTAAVEGDQVCELIWDGPRLLGAGYEIVAAGPGRRRRGGPGLGRAGPGGAFAGPGRGTCPDPGAGPDQGRGGDPRADAAAGPRPAAVPRRGGACGGRSPRSGSDAGWTACWRPRSARIRRRPAQGVARWEVTAVRRLAEAIATRRARQGWRLYATNLPAERMDLGACVRSYRGGWCLERDFHLLKDAPLGIRPLYVRRDDQLVGLSFLLLLALRVLSLCEVLMRRGQQQRGDRLAGLYPGQPSRRTDQPTGLAVLRAVARLELTLTRIRVGDESAGI